MVFVRFNSEFLLITVQRFFFLFETVNDADDGNIVYLWNVFIAV